MRSTPSTAGIDQAGIRHHAEVEDGEDEGRSDWRHLLDARGDQAPKYLRLPHNHCGQHRGGDQGDQRRCQPAQNQPAQQRDREEAEGRQHEDRSMIGCFGYFCKLIVLIAYVAEFRRVRPRIGFPRRPATGRRLARTAFGPSAGPREGSNEPPVSSPAKHPHADQNGFESTRRILSP
jgi:hypothetical protein